MRVILEDDIEEFEEEEEGKVPEAETMATEVPVAGGSGTQREAPAERRREPRFRS